MVPYIFGSSFVVRDYSTQYSCTVYAPTPLVLLLFSVQSSWLGMRISLLGRQMYVTEKRAWMEARCPGLRSTYQSI